MLTKEVLDSVTVPRKVFIEAQKPTTVEPDPKLALKKQEAAEPQVLHPIHYAKGLKQEPTCGRAETLTARGKTVYYFFH